MANVVVANSSSNLSGDTLLTAENAETKTGLLTFDRDPSAPFAVSSSSAKVTNLDADMVDGFHAADLAGASVGGNETITGVWTFTTNPVFNSNSIPETAIIDGSLLARVAANETITGTWTFSTPPVFTAGVGAATGKAGGVVYSTVTPVGNVGGGEDTLYTQAVAANTLSTNGQALRAYILGTVASNANGKVIKIYWNGTAIFTSSSFTTCTGGWRANLEIHRTGAATQVIGGTVEIPGTTSGDTFYAAGTATLSGAVTFAATGTATSDNDITVQAARIYWEPTP